MLKTFTYPRYAYQRSAEQRSGIVRRHPVVIVGAGPVGLTAALELAQRGIPAVILDDSDTVSIGSRAVCYAKRPLEIWDRLGVASPMVQRGVKWQVGRVFFRDEEVYHFDLLPVDRQQMPAMINLQQYHLESGLVDACQANERVDLRWKHRVISLRQHAPRHEPPYVTLVVETPDGVFEMQAQWVLACDGANSDIRRMVGAGFSGQFFHDRFLIADIVMKADFPSERWFWFDPPFHPGQSVLLHKQCDDVWRIDFQLGWDVDPEEEKQPQRVVPRIQAMLGQDVPFELEWVSVYQFACRRIDQFRRGRVLFAGDAAHQVSPFGARGANTGIQDIDNLGWKLASVLTDQAPESLLDSYHAERAWAADDNLRQSTRSTDFITPKSSASRHYRNAVLELARTEPFARPLVNSGRLSTPTPYVNSPLNTPDTDDFACELVPGTVCTDAPVRQQGQDSWLLQHLGRGFTVLAFEMPQPTATVRSGAVGARWLTVSTDPDAGADLHDLHGLVTQRLDAQPGTVYLIRPDQHVAARWRRFDPAALQAALSRCLT